MASELVTALLSLWITLVFLQSFVHNFMIETMNDKPNYIQWFIIRGFFAILYGCAYNVLNMGEYFPILVFQVSSHVVIFAPTVNKLRAIKHPLAGFTFWYLGKDSGWFDKLFIKNKPLYKVVYFMAAALMVLSIVTIYFRYAE